jgi:hypothetical protein
VIVIFIYVFTHAQYYYVHKVVKYFLTTAYDGFTFFHNKFYTKFIYWLADVQSTYQEKIPARNAIYAHAQDFTASGQLLLAILKAFFPQLLNKQRTIGFHVF